MLDQIRPGDVIIVWKLDRLARSTRDLLNAMDTINEAGGKFQSVSEPWADTTTHAGKMIMTVFAGIAEFERDLIRERTGAGREAAGTCDAVVARMQVTMCTHGRSATVTCRRDL